MRRSSLELVFLERLQRRRASAQRVVLGHAVKDMHAAVVEQGGLGDRALGRPGTNIAAAKRFVRDFLNRFEAMSFGAFVFVKRHEESFVSRPGMFHNARSLAVDCSSILSQAISLGASSSRFAFLLLANFPGIRLHVCL